ncbi:VWA domain-containing protein [Flavobacteriaceae bacterium TP-CH-4]|uniref:VWA domain-containing protein n=1 Tax=Pelagihabitans pacificus TaxID=2696054 RepID=A0A967ATY8_9FLAO|nr:VWA domain-containing protein [Pelagihabitans pacificus]NHF59887.1 VWA domain-containing protein [Pelagihabitans pacificus]
MQAITKTFKERLIDFTMYCRERQFVLGPQETRDAFEVAERGWVLDRKLFQYSLKAIYCKRKEHFDRFDEMFDRFWSRYYEEKLEQRKKQIKQLKKEKDTATVIFLGTEFKLPKKEVKEQEAKETVGANESIRLRFTDFSKVNVTDKEKLEELAEELFHQMSMRFKRRLENANQGSIDVRNTIRQGISKGGMLLHLAYKRKRKEKRKVVFILDVSGSMDTYSYYLLRYVMVLKKYFKSLEFFTFSTELTHVTPMLRQNNEQEILRQIGKNVHSWSSGTKIGASLTEFLAVYGSKFLSQKHIVVILSDGLETGNVTILKEAVRTIRRKCKTLIWLNPLKGMAGYQPIQKGMVNVMPHLDAFESAHNLDSLLKLEKLLMDV